MRKIFLNILTVIVAVSVIFIITEAVMIKSVENVKTDFFNVVCDNKEDGIDYGSLLNYDYSRFYKIETVDKIALDIRFVFHGSEKGYMYVEYSFDINKNSFGTGAYKVPSKWYIKKAGNRWIVYDIDEAP